MKTVFRRRGYKENFIVNFDTEVPVPCKTSVIVKVVACCLSQIHEQYLDEILLKNELIRVGCAISGIVTVIGSEVTSLKVGDEVIGLLPVTATSTGCAEFCEVHEYNLVTKPADLDWVDGTSALDDCVRSYTALVYLGQVCAGDTVLILDGSSPSGYIMTQFSQVWGAKVLTVSPPEDISLLEKLQPPIAHIIPVTDKNLYLIGAVKEETGGLGVDCIVDNGVRMFTGEDASEEDKKSLPHKHDLLSSLAIRGRWVTSQWNLQLDPPDSIQLYLRGAQVNFLFHMLWSMTNSQQGRYHHILLDAVEKLSAGLIKPKPAKVISFEEFTEKPSSFLSNRNQNIVVTMTNSCDFIS